MLCVAAWTLALAGCSSPAGSETGPAEEAAEAFRTAHAEALGKTVDEVAIVDEGLVAAALGAHDALSAAAQGLPGVEKGLLDSLHAKIGQLKTPGTNAVETSVFVFADDGALLAGNTENPGIDRSERESLTVTAAAGLEAIQWSLNGANLSAPRGTAQSVTIEAAKYPAGKYRLGLAAKKDGIDYSVDIAFVVVE
jgi:hypothetical protein